MKTLLLMALIALAGCGKEAWTDAQKGEVYDVFALSYGEARFKSHPEESGTETGVRSGIFGGCARDKMVGHFTYDEYQGDKGGKTQVLIDDGSLQECKDKADGFTL